MTECWRIVPSLPKYEASTQGRIRVRKTGRILPTYPDKYGALVVNTCYRGVQTSKRVARLVGETWSNAYNQKLRPTYRDGNRANCAATNLKWVPVSQVTKAPYSTNPKPTERKPTQCQQD